MGKHEAREVLDRSPHEVINRYYVWYNPAAHMGFPWSANSERNDTDDRRHRHKGACDFRTYQQAMECIIGWMSRDQQVYENVGQTFYYPHTGGRTRYKKVDHV